MDEYKIVKFEQNGVVLDVTITLEKETAWLSIDDMALLYSRDRSTIGKHIRTIIKEEFDKGSVWAKFARTVAKNATVQLEGSKKVTRQITYYNMDVAISIEHRVKSQNGLLLKEFINNYFYRNSKKKIIPLLFIIMVIYHYLLLSPQKKKQFG